MSMNDSKQRLDWVDYAKGICMFAVVSLYSTTAARDLLGSVGWMQYWADFARPFRMPDFFLLSGLFLARTIDRKWLHYLDKKVVHYCYFFLMWAALNLAIQYLSGELVWKPNRVIVDYWASITSWPFHMLWFIQMLPAYFLLAKLTRNVPVWIILPVSALLYVFPPFNTGRTLIDHFWNGYVFFYVGATYYPYIFKFSGWVSNNVWKAIGCIFIWAIANQVFVSTGLSHEKSVALVLGVVGACAIIAIASLIKKVSALNWVEYLGKNSIVVYLAFYWPMQFAAYWLSDYGFFRSFNGLFTIAITIAGLLGSFMLYWLVKTTKFGAWLFIRPSWASIYKPRAFEPSLSQ